jgi:F420-dependent methylenetetrahydromethanopterin dehydrogenase
LRLKRRPPREAFVAKFEPLRDIAKRRNVRLRVLHGGVDIEPSNMDAAKAEYLDRQEKQQAARDVRAARERMKRELGDVDEGK